MSSFAAHMKSKNVTPQKNRFVGSVESYYKDKNQMACKNDAGAWSWRLAM